GLVRPPLSLAATLAALPSMSEIPSFVVNELRWASNEGTLRAFRNADRFTTFKIFRRPGALRRRLAPGQSRRSDRIGRPKWGWQINLVCASARGCLAR